MMSEQTRSEKMTKILTFFIRRLLIVAITIFVISAITFYFVQTEIDECSSYQVNSAYAQVEESTFSIIKTTFQSYFHNALSKESNQKGGDIDEYPQSQ